MRVLLSIPSRKGAPVWLLALTVLAGCETAAVAPADKPPEPGVLEVTRNGPADAPEGSCWGKTVTPAVVESVVKQVQIKPAQVNPDGTVAAPPKYRTETTQEIISARRDNWFETPCADVLTPEFIASLQRALIARGFYAGEVNGVLDVSTRKAVQNFQRIAGPDSSVLSLASARQLGLIAVPRDATE